MNLRLYTPNELLREADARLSDPLIAAMAAQLAAFVDGDDETAEQASERADKAELEADALEKRLYAAEAGIADLREALASTLAFCEGFEDDECQDDMSCIELARDALAGEYTDEESAAAEAERKRKRDLDTAIRNAGATFANLVDQPAAIEYRMPRARTWKGASWRVKTLAPVHVEEAKRLARESGWAEWRFVQAA